jgi:hypothetical protein
MVSVTKLKARTEIIMVLNPVMIPYLSHNDDLQPKKTIDMKMIVFPVPVSCVTTANPDLFSSSETGVNRGIRSRNQALI